MQIVHYLIPVVTLALFLSTTLGAPPPKSAFGPSLIPNCTKLLPAFSDLVDSDGTLLEFWIEVVPLKPIVVPYYLNALRHDYPVSIQEAYQPTGSPDLQFDRYIIAPLNQARLLFTLVGGGLENPSSPPLSYTTKDPPAPLYRGYNSLVTFLDYDDNLVWTVVKACNPTNDIDLQLRAQKFDDAYLPGVLSRLQYYPSRDFYNEEIRRLLSEVKSTRDRHK